MDTKRVGGNSPAIPPNQETLDAPPSRSIPLASNGIRTTTDIKKVGLALAEDVLRGAVAPKVAGSAVSAISMTLRTFQLEMRHCENHAAPAGGIDLLESPQSPDPVSQEREQLLRRLAELDAASGKALDKTPGAARRA